MKNYVSNDRSADSRSAQNQFLFDLRAFALISASFASHALLESVSWKLRPVIWSLSPVPPCGGRIKLFASLSAICVSSDNCCLSTGKLSRL